VTGTEREIYYFQNIFDNHKAGQNPPRVVSPTEEEEENIFYQTVIRVPLLVGQPSISGMWP
jgi:hypothetical protein